jgi:hypothetical protein
MSRTAKFLPKSVKDPGKTFNLAKSGQELCRPWYIFHGIFIKTPAPHFFSNKISTLIFEKKLWRGDIYKYPIKNISRTAKFLPTFGQVKGIVRVFNSWYSVHGIFIKTPSTFFFSNIKVDIWHSAVDLRCIIPPRHWSQLKTRTIPLNYLKIYQGRQSSCPPLAKLKVLSGSLTDLSA